MTTAGIVFQRGPSHIMSYVRPPVAVKFCDPVGLGAYSETRAPTDAVGAFELTLTNVVVGSALQIESQDGATVLYNGTAVTGNPTINLSAYAAGSPLNDLRIKVRKGTSSPYYRPFETLTTAIIGSQSIYVAQIPDD